MKFNSKLLFILFIMFLNFNLISAADDDIDYCNINLNGDSIPILLIGLLISILFVSLFYMYGKFMNNSEVEGTYVVELQQIGLTLVMIIFITAGIEVLCGVSFNEKGLLLSDSENVYSAIKNTQLKLMTKTMSFYTSLMNAVNSYSVLGSAQAGFGASGFSIGFSPVSGGSFIAQTMAPIGQSVLIAYFAQAFQYALFEFSRSKIFLMLLPIGLVLRSFPLTRKFGGVLVALVLGLSYLYPLFLNLGYLFVNIDSIKNVYRIPALAILIPISVSMIALSYAAVFAPQITFTIMGVIILFVFGASSFAEMFGSGNQLAVLSTFSLTGEPFLFMIGDMYSSFGTIILGTFFIPALIILVLGAVVRSLSATIGTETDITGILRAI